MSENIDSIGICTTNNEGLYTKIIEVEEIVLNISELNNKYISWIEAMESQYLENKVDEIGAIGRETKQLASEMTKLLENIVQMETNFDDLDDFLSSFEVK